MYSLKNRTQKIPQKKLNEEIIFCLFPCNNLSHDINLHISRDLYKAKSMKDIQIYVVVIFLSHLFFIFPLFLHMIMYANEFETKGKRLLLVIVKMIDGSIKSNNIICEGNFQTLEFACL